jgi:hypothetical protein
MIHQNNDCVTFEDLKHFDANLHKQLSSILNNPLHKLQLGDIYFTIAKRNDRGKVNPMNFGILIIFAALRVLFLQLSHSYVTVFSSLMSRSLKTDRNSN